MSREEKSPSSGCKWELHVCVCVYKQMEGTAEPQSSAWWVPAPTKFTAVTAERPGQ